MGERLRILSDADDVLADNASGFAEFSNRTWGTNLTAEDFSEDWRTMWGVDLAEVNRRAKIFQTSDTVLHYKPIPGATVALQSIGKAHDLGVLTSRRHGLRAHTATWLDQHYPDAFPLGVHYSGIFDTVKTTDAHTITKAEKFLELGGDVLIDDQLKHCAAVAAYGKRAILYGNYAWNQASELPDGVTRCETWEEIEEYFNVAR